MWHLAKSLDPDRLVEDMSVVAWAHLQYYGHGATDMNSWHFYMNDYERRACGDQRRRRRRLMRARASTTSRVSSRVRSR